MRRTAKHIRHAVAIDERRVKFKASLFSQEQNEADEMPDDITEVWFPGNHGDVGGGWNPTSNERDAVHGNVCDDHFQLSDIALKWMMDEVEAVEEARKESSDRIAWNVKKKDSFLERFEYHKKEMISARMHDTLKFNGGLSSKLKVMLWNFMGTSVFRFPCASLTSAIQKRCQE